MAGPKVLVIATNYGPERDELLRPIAALKEAGIDVTVAAPTKDPIQTLIFDVDRGETLEPDVTFDDVSGSDFDLLLVPGGTLNADAIRVNDKALALVREFSGAGKTIASICHGPWLLAEADLLVGKTLTSYQSIKTDMVNSGGTWVDEEVVVDNVNGWTLITSRTPFDLDAFNGKVRDALTALVK